MRKYTQYACYFFKHHLTTHISKKINDVVWCRNCQHGFSLCRFDKKVYDTDYAAGYERYRNSPINKALHKFRREFTLDSAPPFKGHKTLLDFGCATGEFCRSVASSYEVYGYDINKAYEAVWRRDEMGINYSTKLPGNIEFDVVTFFDSIEHVEDPMGLVRLLNAKVVVVSIPIMSKQFWINSKHLKPREHLHYFTTRSLFGMMGMLDYIPVRFSSQESHLGREKITTYAFVKKS